MQIELYNCTNCSCFICNTATRNTFHYTIVIIPQSLLSYLPKNPRVRLFVINSSISL